MAAALVAAISACAQDAAVVVDPVRLNGESIASPRRFYELVTGCPPGSEVTLDVLREGKPAVYVLPVRQVDTTPHAWAALSTA